MLRFLEAILLLTWLASSLGSDPYEHQPKLVTENGHLVIKGALHKNITLRTSGLGYVNLDGENLLHITQMAKQAAETVARYEDTTVGSTHARLGTLTHTVMGPHGLVTKVTHLEELLLSGNLSTSQTYGNSRRLGIRVNRLATRLRSIELQVRNMKNLLTVDECLSNPCRNGGTCQDLYNGFICFCPGNWEGTLCEMDVNECAEMAGADWGCQNGATCVNKPGTYECLCSDTYFGLHCTLRTNDCSAQNSAGLCGHGVCINQGGNGRGYICMCDEGWEKDAAGSCTMDVDECQAKHYPCSHDPLVQCINLPGSFHCGFCPPGFSGNGFQCSDIDECQNNNGGCSLVPRVPCINTRGSRVCGHCPPGFTGDGMFCASVTGGACAINNGGCHPAATCFQNAGIVSCRCADGYAGDGYGPGGCTLSSAAIYRHPCHSNPCKNGGTCVLDGSTYRCVCHPHLTGNDCEEVVYASCSTNPCQNNGSCSVQFDQSFPTQVRCTCSPGFQGRYCELQSSVCGGTFYQDIGEITISAENQAVQRYEHGQLCTWRIEVASKYIVQITIQELTMEFTPNCADNYLKISDPMSPGALKTLCHGELADLKPPVKSTTNVATVQFKASSGTNKNHFHLTWAAVHPGCGGEINAEDHGVIESPGFPQNYPDNLNCEWKMFARPGKKIQFIFTSLDLQLTTDCSNDYLSIQELEDNEPSSLLAKFCNSSTPAPVITHLPAAYIFFHTDSVGSGKGFRIMYTLIDSCGGVLTSASGDISPPMSSFSDSKVYAGDQDCEWRIQLPLGDKIKITFNKFDLEDREICDDFLEVRDGPRATSPVVGRWCGTTIPPSYTSSSNTLTVLFHSDFIFAGEGFVLHYETLCGGAFEGRSGELHSPNYPLSYAAQRECVYTISTPPSTVIQLHFEDFELEQLGDYDCLFDYVEVRDGDNANSTLLGRYCGSQKPADVISNFNYLHITFASDDSNHYRGFLAKYTAMDTPCGGILREPSGMFSSPQNEDGYLPNSQCVWLISAPDGFVIQLSWVVFHLEWNADCNMDAVEVYENNTLTGESSLIDKYCGLKIPPSTMSTTNLMTVKFKSDDSIHREGFTANYITVDKRRVCGGNYRSVAGTLTSPNYPNDYPNNKECTWTIHVPQGQQITLQFEEFQLDGTSGSCNYDTLTIRNGLHETSPLVGKFCGSDIPPAITSLTNALWIHFSTDRSDTFKGFQATWDATATGCGGTLTSPSGTIMSPNYPQAYSRFAECFFRISIAEGSRVRLSIVDLEMEANSWCSLDYIELFDGRNDRAKSLGRFCSPTHPATVLASSNHLFIKFVSDISYSGRGFHLKYNSECNITLKGYHGVIESPNYPEKYLPNENCMWMIQAPRGNKVNISFTHFHLEDSSQPFLSKSKTGSECRYDYLEISEGTKNETASKTWPRICGTEVPGLIHSQLDQVYVHFVTDHMLEYSGFRLEYAVSGCGGVYREKPSGTITSPNYPHGYPSEVTCEWNIIAPWDKSIEITVNELLLEDIGACDYDFLAVFAGEDDTAPLMLKTCHRQTKPVKVTTSGNNAFIRFESDYSISGKGFSASWKFVDSKCGGKFTSSWGSIHSHNYPKNYENNDDCEWLIEVLPNHLVNLTFTDFDVEPAAGTTTTDYVNVYDGNSTKAPLLLSHSGNSLPTPPYVISTSNTLLIRHKADGSLTAKGFSANYAVSCGARIEAKGTGTFSLDESISASSPFANEENTNCTWYITATDPGDKILLTFTHLDSSPSAENAESTCSYNYVAVHDGDDTNATILARDCGTKVPLPVRSSGSALTVTAVSLTYSRTHLGRFTATYSTYSTACGGEMTSEAGGIASPNFPDGYPANAECEWQLKASVGNTVTLSFTSFELEESEFCNADYVEVRSGGSNGTLQGVFCGSTLPTNLTAANSLWLRFRTDGVNTAKGFNAVYSLVHGNNLVGDTGQIASPFYPQPHVQAGTYKWTIGVSYRKVVHITFSDFYVDRYSNDFCSNYVQIYDGLSEESPSLGQLCGAALPDPITSTGNVVTIVLSNEPWMHGSYFLLSWQAVAPGSVKVTNTTVEETLGCGQIVTISPSSGNHSVTITSPNFPARYKPDSKCTWILNTASAFHLELKFNSVDLENFDDCEADYIQVFTESKTNVGEWVPISENICMPNSTVFQGGSRMKLYFETDPSIQQTGFSAQVDSVCGGVLRDSSGEIDTSNLKPANISTDKILCEWEIRVRSGRTIQFTFEKFDLPLLDRDSCSFSYIMFRNGGYKDSPPLGDGKYCGSVFPRIPETNSNRAYISYSATARTPGLILKYQEVDVECNTRISLTEPTQAELLSSPNYPQSPSTPHITCTWTVSAPPGQSILLDFVKRFDIKPSVGCTVEYLEVRDGGTEISPLIGRYCKTNPPPITSLSNHLYIKYFTDAETPNNGFQAQVKLATCGGTYFDAIKVVINSPGYPLRFPPNTTCVWRIVGYNMNYQLEFNVTDLWQPSLGESHDNSCVNAQDVITVYNVPPVPQFNLLLDENWQSQDSQDPLVPEGAQVLKKLCGSLQDKDYNKSDLIPPSASNEVYIVFKSGPKKSFEPLKKFSIAITPKYKSCHHEINAASGIIMSPGYPTPPPHNAFLYCMWVIKVPEGHKVSLTIEDFDVEPSKDFTHIALYGGDSFYKLRPFNDSDLIGKTIDSFDNQMKVIFREEHVTGAHKGFRATFSSDKLIECGGELRDNTTVSFSNLGKNVTSYICFWWFANDLLTFNNQTTLALTINGTVNNKNNGTCALWGSMEDIIVIHNKRIKTAVNKVLALLCENELQSVTIRSPFPELGMVASKRDFSWLMPKSEPLVSVANFTFSLRTHKCGGLVSGPEALIESPEFPRQYPGSVDCAWLVQFQPSTRIQVKLEVLDLDADCSKDFITLYNGDLPTAPHLSAPLCGNNLPGEWITQGHQLFVEFHSGAVDPLKPHRGFQLRLTQDTSGCGGVYSLLTGQIQSPQYGTAAYSNNLECIWTVRLPPGYHAGLKFVDRFYLETSNNCTSDYVQISQWQGDKWEQVGSNVCGRSAPDELETKTNQFRVVFRTNNAITGDGFKLTWQSLCGGEILVKSNGTIISPAYPKLYSSNLNCTYTLLAPNKVIYGEFQDFQIEEGRTGDDGGLCKFDNVTLTYRSQTNNRLSLAFHWSYSGRFSAQTVQTTRCGSTPPDPVFSMDKLVLSFKTDSFLNMKGFLFNYSIAGCGGNITSPTVLSNPSNSHFRNCTWYITAPADKVVVFKIQRVGVFFMGCANNRIRLYEGLNPLNSSAIIETICPSHLMRPAVNHKRRYTSQGNTMTINYLTSQAAAVPFQAAIGFSYGEKQSCGGTLRLESLPKPYVLKSLDMDSDGKYESMLSCAWTLLAPNSHQIRLTFNKLDIQNCSTTVKCGCDYLEVRDGDHENSPLVDRFCGSTLPSDITSSSGRLYVHFFSDGTTQLSGFQITVASFLSPCGQIVLNATQEVQVLNSPGYPAHSGDSSLFCFWTILPGRTGLLSLHITDLDLSAPCDLNYLRISERSIYLTESNLATGLWAHLPFDTPNTLCGSLRDMSFTYSGRSVQLRYATNQASAHRGFSLEYKMKDCNENYTSSSGRLIANRIYQSESFEDKPTCASLIQVPQENVTVALYFNNFLCIDSGKMIVYDGTSSQANELASFCGTKTPNPIFSTGPALFVTFRSTSRFAKYDITYTSTDQGRGCGGTLNDLTGSFSSPLYPSKLDRQTSCRWDISVPQGRKLRFNFVYFDIGPLHTCNSDYIQFYDVSSTETLHSKYCGTDKPATIQMNGNSAFVRYVTSQFNNGTGWLIRWYSSN